MPTIHSIHGMWYSGAIYSFTLITTYIVLLKNVFKPFGLRRTTNTPVAPALYEHVCFRLCVANRTHSDLQPGVWYACIVHAVKGISKVFRHDDRAVNSQLEIGQCWSNRSKHFLHPVDLLTQEDVQRLNRSDLLQAILHLYDAIRQEIFNVRLKLKRKSAKMAV